MLHSGRFADVPRPWRGRRCRTKASTWGSASTFYRLLRQAGESRERRRQAGLAEELTADTCAKQHISRGQLAMHADRGSSMTSKPVALLLLALGEQRVDYQRFARATDCYLRALDLARQISMLPEQARALAGLGRCDLASGDTDTAAARLRQAQTIFQRSGAAEAAQVAAELKALRLVEA